MFFFKQKTAYEMRISDWSSDVCSSDLAARPKIKLAAFVIFGLAAAPAYAAYPEKPIEIVVGYAAGGGTDVMARTVGKYLEKALGNGATVVIRNVPGAGGTHGGAPCWERVWQWV